MEKTYLQLWNKNICDASYYSDEVENVPPVSKVILEKMSSKSQKKYKLNEKMGLVKKPSQSIKALIWRTKVNLKWW